MSDVDALFGDLVVAQGIASRERVTECLEELKRLRTSGSATTPTLGELLVRRGYLTAETLRRTLPCALAAMTPETPGEVAAAAADPANLLGRYVVVAALGAGGMGEVWKAWDRELLRWVALKFLKQSDASVLERFRAEAQTAAGLNHPNIAAVYDVGLQNGRAYIAMQYVSGRSLAEMDRGDRDRVVRLLRDAALAVHAAHERGIIHRDLKPGNLMYEGERVYVMDFGLARRTDVKGTLTASGAAVGTPVYMPPEQAAGEKADRRSDVYGLGATLYDLLTGRHSFEGDTVIDILIHVLEGDIAPPRRLDRRIDADLETIVMKCLEMEPSRRYPTARELAEDLTRWLEGDAILARPASFLYRARKYAGRRKARVAAVALATALLVSVGVYWFAIRPASATLALEAEVFGPIRQRLADLPGTAEGYRRGLQLLEEGLVRCPGSSDAWLLRGDLHERLGDAESALECYAKAIALNRGLAVAFYRRGRVLMDLRDRKDEAKRELQEAMRVEPENELALVAAARLSILAKEFPGALHYLELAERNGKYLAELYMLRAVVLQDPKGGYFDEQKALEALNRSLALQGTSAAVYNRGCLRMTIARGLRRRGSLDAAVDAAASAIDDYSLAVKVQAENEAAMFNRSHAYTLLADLRPAKAAEYRRRAREDLDACIRVAPRKAEAWSSRGLLRRDAGDLDGGLADLMEATAVDPGSAMAFSNLATTRHALALLLLDQGRADVAAKELARALAASDRAVDLDPSSAAFYVNRAVTRRLLGDGAGAGSDIDRAIELDAALPEAHAERGNALLEGATALHWAGRSAEAVDACRKALVALDRAVEGDRSIAATYANRGRARALTGDALAAMRRRGESVEWWAAALEDQDRAMRLGEAGASALYQRARLKDLLGDGDGALADYTESLRLDPGHKDSAYNRGCLLRARGALERAIADFTRALETDPSHYGAIMNRAVTRGELGMAEEKAGRRQEAAEAWSKALEDYNRAGALRPDDPQLYRNRAALLTHVGIWAQAEKDLTRALELDPRHLDALAARASLRLTVANYDGAMRDAQEALKRAPKDWPLRGAVERVLEQARAGKP